MEDAPDSENPPHAPTPPSAIPNNRDSVFDYMVADDQPNTPKIQFSKKSREEMAMKNGAPPLFTDSRASSRSGYRNNEERVHSQDYQEHGFSYGTEPVNPRPYNDVNPSYASLDFMTPAARATKLRLEGQDRPSLGHSRQNSGSEKKRKRGQTDPNGTDTPMTDADGQLVTVENTPSVMHSGLTGGLNRMMSEDNEAFPFSNSPPGDERDRNRDRDRGSKRAERYEEPASPLKKTRHSKDDPGLGISIKGRAVKALSMVGGALLPAPQDANTSKTRRRASSSDHDRNYTRGREGEKRERKKHKVHRHNGTASANIRHDHSSRRRGSAESPEAQRRKLKAIEYRKYSESGSDSDDDRKKNGASQMVIFGAEEKQKKRCETFLSNIPGTESEKGYSIHKALKRWHKQGDTRSSSSRAEEEQELWRGLRLRKNDRGEIVLSF